MPRRIPVPLITFAITFAFVGSACTTAANTASTQGSPGTSSGIPTPSASPAATGDAKPDAAAWCAMVIDINTRGGTMVNKQYILSGLRDPVKAMAVAQEGVNRRGEILAITPSEIKDAMTHELDYYAAALKNPTAGMGDYSAADQQTLIDFQKTQCGIGGI